MVKGEVNKEVKRLKRKAAKKNKDTPETPGLDTLKGNERCPMCGGRGTLTMVNPKLDAMKFRMLVPCPCVRRVIEWRK